MKVNPSDNPKKRFVATFKDGSRTHFGQPKPTLKRGTYIAQKDKKLRENWRKRHEPQGKKFYTNPKRASTLARFVLWGEQTDLKGAVKAYNKRFNLTSN